MNLANTLLIVSAALINAAGSTVMKCAMSYRAAPGSSTPLFWLLMLAAMVLYGGGFPLFAIGLSRSRLSVAQPVFSATSYVAITLVALFLFKETLVPLKAAGLVVIVAGIVMVVA